MRGPRPTPLVALAAFALVAGCQVPKPERGPVIHESRYTPAAFAPITVDNGKITARGAAPDLFDKSAVNERPALSLTKDSLAALRVSEPLNPELRWVASQGGPVATDSAATKPAQYADSQNPPKRDATPAPQVRSTPPVPVSVQPPPRIVGTSSSVVVVGGVPVPVPSNPLPTPVRPVTIPQQPPPVVPVVRTEPTVPKPTPVSTAPIYTEPPIRLPDPTPDATPPSKLPPLVESRATSPQVPVVPPMTNLPAIPTVSTSAPVTVPGPVGVGPIEMGGNAVPYATLARMIDGRDLGPELGSPGTCSTCEGGACGPGQCRAGGGGHCEPFYAVTPVGRFVNLIYQCVCCPDPCYRPHWEPIADAAFFTDAPRPVTQTRVRWDYYNHLTYPDRGEFLMPRTDGGGKGPKPNPPARGIAYLDYHQLSIQAEAAAGPASVTIVTPYNSLNPYPFANSAAGFGDVQITAKNILYDCELFIFSFQMRTYIPSGNFSKGLGAGHMALEPGLISGIRLGQVTYAVAQVAEYIPLGGDQDYQGAHLRFNFSLNHILWQPVKDVQFVGTLELNGINWQDGAFTDAVDGPLQKLSGQTAIGLGCGGRLFFCDKFDAGIGGMFGITGKYWAREQMRFEVRYRF